MVDVNQDSDHLVVDENDVFWDDEDDISIIGGGGSI